MRIAPGLLLLLLLLTRQPLADEFKAPVLGDFDDCLLALGQTAGSGDWSLDSVLRVGSWNIMKEQREGASALHRRLIDDTDLYLTQEAVRREDATPYTMFAPGYRRGELQTGVATHSRFRADVVCTLSFVEPWLRSPKAVLATRFPSGPKALLVVNLHAINFTLGTEAYARQLAAVAKLVKVHDGPAIVAGDLNNWNSQRERVLMEFANDAGLRRVEFSPDWRSRHLGTPVDGALVRGFRVVSAAALPTTRSDHHPLLLLLAAQSSSGAGTLSGDAQPTPAR